MKKFVSESEYFSQKKMYNEIKQLYTDRKYKSVIKMSEKFLETFGNDINVLFIRSKCYRQLEMYKNAINDLKYIIFLDPNDKHAAVELFYLYYHLNMYEDALKLNTKLYDMNALGSYSLSIPRLVIKKSLNLKYNSNVHENEIIKRQIIDYDKDLSINHIKEHIFDDSDNKYNFSTFKDSINIDYLYETVVENLSISKKANQRSNLEIHYFGINNIGYSGDDICNYLKVIVVPNTKNIVTMYPISDIEDYKFQPLRFDYDKLYIEKPKVKTMSKIDRFNKRYKRV